MKGVLSVACLLAFGIDDRLRGSQEGYRSEREFSFDSRRLQECGRIFGTYLHSRQARTSGNRLGVYLAISRIALQ